jgi:hypothetical protein
MHGECACCGKGCLVERAQDPCPLHGPVIMPWCAWCTLAAEQHLLTARDVLAAQVRRALESPGGVARRLVRLMVVGMVDDAAAVTAAIQERGRQPHRSRLLIKADGMLELE